MRIADTEVKYQWINKRKTLPCDNEGYQQNTVADALEKYQWINKRFYGYENLENSRCTRKMSMD